MNILEEVYSPQHETYLAYVWTEFVERFMKAKKEYRKLLGEHKIATLKKVAEQEGLEIVLDFLLEGISIKRTSQFLAINENIVKNFITVNNIPKNPSAETLKRIPGAFSLRNTNEIYLASLDEKSIAKDYEAGIGLIELSKKYKTGQKSIRKIIVERTNIKIREASKVSNSKTIEKLSMYSKEFYLNMYENNKDWSLVDFIDEIKKLFPDFYLSSKTVSHFISNELCLKPDSVRQNAARKKKCLTEKNKSYMVKMRTIEMIKASSYGSVDELTKKYCSNKEGSYSTIAERINKETGFDCVTTSQISKLITNNKNYVKKRSRSEAIFIEEIKKALKLSEEDIVREKRICKNTMASIDVYIPSISIGFEFNGDYWHSNEVVHFNHHVTARKYHQNKLDLCRQIGIKLLYVWEDDFNKNFDKILSLIQLGDFDNKIFKKLESKNTQTHSLPKVRYFNQKD